MNYAAAESLRLSVREEYKAYFISSNAEVSAKINDKMDVAVEISSKSEKLLFDKLNQVIQPEEVEETIEILRAWADIIDTKDAAANCDHRRAIAALMAEVSTDTQKTIRGFSK